MKIEIYTKSLWERYLSTNDVTGIDIDLDVTDGKGHFLVGTADPSGGRSFFATMQLIKNIWRYCAWHGIPAIAFKGERSQVNRWWYKEEDLNGCGYTPAQERELYEIWRELIEYGDTDMDYDTWRALAGDEYARAYVLPFVK